jgi:hypothetical protein
MDRVHPYLAELLRRSSERVGENQEFAYVREDIEQVRKQQEDKTLSLNEQTRLREMDEAETRMKARDRERKARTEPELTTYEITLKLAELPGLPPPLQKTNRLSGASATNSADIASVDAAVAEEDEEQGPGVDAVLLEAQRILLDYVKLLPRAGAVAVTRDVDR